jgi:hypothetical protein
MAQPISSIINATPQQICTYGYTRRVRNIRYSEKDQVEHYLHGQVCSGAMSLQDAQTLIACLHNISQLRQDANECESFSSTDRSRSVILSITEGSRVSGRQILSQRSGLHQVIVYTVLQDHSKAPQ